MVAAATLAACDHRTVYSHFEHTSVAGWERNDTLLYSISPMAADADYQEDLALRISGDYPFTGISLIVEQTVFPSHQTYKDTLACTLTDELGNITGQGTSLYQYRFPLRPLHLAAGDSISIALRHDMKREMLPGITDVGILLSRH